MGSVNGSTLVSHIQKNVTFKGPHVGNPKLRENTEVWNQHVDFGTLLEML